MKTNLNLLFVLSIFSFVFSCRTTPENEKVDENNILTNNPISVKINLPEIVFEDGNIENSLITENNSRGGGNSLINNSLDTYTTHYIDDYSFLDVKKITNTPQDNEYLSSLGLSADTNLREYLPNGAKYTILAYKGIGIRYIFHKQQEFTVGDVNPKIELDGNQDYALLIVSTGNSTSAKIENASDFYSARYIAENGNLNCLIKVIEGFTPSGDRNNVLNIKLKGSAGVSVIIDVSEFSPDSKKTITSVENIKFTFLGIKSLSLYSMVPKEYKKATMSIKNTSFLNGRTQYKIDFHNVFRATLRELEFSADIKISGNTEFKKIRVPEGIYINYGSVAGHYTFVIKPRLCGAYFSENHSLFREFMCHNLGATDSNTRGNLYAWGRKAVVYKNTGNPCDEEGRTWREEEDPCPAGYRLPQVYEVRFMENIKVNKHTKLYNANGEFIGFRIGNNFNIFVYDKSKKYNDFNGGSAKEMSTMVYCMAINLRDESFERGSCRRSDGYPVRCIKKHPKEKTPK